MLKVDYLTNVLEHLDKDGNWDIKLIFSRLPKDFINATDLLMLPPIYLTKMRSSVSRYTYDELKDFSIKELIEILTGENYDKIAKLVNVAKKVQSLEQDFN